MSTASRAMPDRRSRGQVPQAHQQPRDSDALVGRMCPRCGIPGAPHADPEECISELRDALADATGGPLRKRVKSAQARG